MIKRGRRVGEGPIDSQDDRLTGVRRRRDNVDRPALSELRANIEALKVSMTEHCQEVRPWLHT